MGLFQTSMPVCPRNQHCSQWAKKNMKYCLCSAKDGVSLTLGIISVVSWGVAEIPQIITNYREKSAEGLSIAFLFTWILGDLFNVFGCILEPATLPTQFYMALLYTITTGILGAQTIYYGHIYPKLKYRRRQQKINAVDRTRQSHGNANVKQVNSDDEKSNEFNTSSNASSSPIPLPMLQQNNSLGREVYYTSARSLSSSHTPTAGSFLMQRMTPTSSHIQNPMQEPLLDVNEPGPSVSPRNVKNMLCVVSMVTFFATLHQSAENRWPSVSGNPNIGLVIPVGRKLLQAGGELLQNNGSEGSSGVGTYLGWAMAAIYMGGRLPQIFLNIRRGNVEGLSPLMFIFALIGNSTYVASILVSSTDWSRIQPNLPWLVDAGGCVLLDTFILIQFIYFRCCIPRDRVDKLVPPSTV